ncbi:uncharacterized protein [Rutidosis leptorrhynchoides]|uniref:uncharacterized protein isoform X2 n=1 Tax=Rutidosis leptorrhynchoides TaxID=125765 RepID=UPI003A99E907
MGGQKPYRVAREDHPVLKYLDYDAKTYPHEQIHLFETEEEVLEKKGEPITILTYVGISKWNFVFSVSPICLMIDESTEELRVWKKSVDLKDVLQPNNCIEYKLNAKPIYQQSEGLETCGLSYYMYRKDDGEFYEHKKGITKDKPLPNGMSDVIRIAGYASSSSSDKVSLTADADDLSDEYEYVYADGDGKVPYKYYIKLKRTVYTVYFGCKERYMQFTEFKYGGHENCKLCYGEYSSPFHNTVPQVVNFDTYLAKVISEKKRLDDLEAASKTRSQNVETIFGSVIKMTSILKDDRSKNVNYDVAIVERLKKEGYKNRHNHPNILITHQSEDDYYYRYGSEDFQHISSEFLQTLKLMETKMKEKFVRGIVEGFVALHKHKPKRKHVNLTKDNVKICKNSSANSYIAKVEDESLLCRKKTDSQQSVKDVPYEFELEPYEEDLFQEELKALGKVCFFFLTGCELGDLDNGACSDVDFKKLSKYPAEAQDLIRLLVRSKGETRHYLGGIPKKDDKKKPLYEEIEEFLTDNLATEVLLKVIVEPLKVIDKLPELSQASLDARALLPKVKTVISKFRSHNLSKDDKEALNNAIKKLNTVNVASFSVEKLQKLKQLSQMKKLTNAEEDLKVIHQSPTVTGTHAVLSKVIKVLETVKDVSLEVTTKLSKAIDKLQKLNDVPLLEEQLDPFQKMEGLFTHYHGPDVLFKEITSSESQSLEVIIDDLLLKVTGESSEANTVLTKLIEVLSEANKVPLELKKVLPDKINKLKKADVTSPPLSKEVFDELSRLQKWKEIVDEPGISLVTNIRNSVSHTTHTLQSVESVRKDYPTILINLYNIMAKKCDDIRINESYFEWTGKLKELAGPQEGPTEPQEGSAEHQVASTLVEEDEVEGLMETN